MRGRGLTLHPFWRHAGRTVERISGRSPLVRGRPAVLAGAMDRRAGCWDLARLRAEYGDAPVPVRESDAAAPQLFAGDPRRAFRFRSLPLAEVLDGFSRESGPRRYVQMCDLAKEMPRLASDLPAPLQAGRLYASPAYGWMCGGGTLNPLHFDFNEALVGQVLGEKHFLLFAPEDSTKISGRVERAIFRTTTLDFQDPDERRYPRLDSTRPYTAVVGPGDILYIPYRWWHAMVAPEPSVSVTWWWEPSRVAHVRHTVRQRLADGMKVVMRALELR